MGKILWLHAVLVFLVCWCLKYFSVFLFCLWWFNNILCLSYQFLLMSPRNSISISANYLHCKIFDFYLFLLRVCSKRIPFSSVLKYSKTMGNKLTKPSLATANDSTKTKTFHENNKINFFFDFTGFCFNCTDTAFEFFPIGTQDAFLHC